MKDLINDLKFRYPLIGKLVSLFGFSLVLFTFFIVIILYTNLDVKLTQLKDGIYWTSKQYLYDGDSGSEGQARSTAQFSAEFIGIDKNSHAMFLRFSDNGRVTFSAEFADLTITKHEQVVKYMSQFKGENLYFDNYQYQDKEGKTHNCVVIWDTFEKPINLDLVSHGFAQPVNNPPTNIVNTLYAKFAWKQFFGEN